MSYLGLRRAGVLLTAMALVGSLGQVVAPSAQAIGSVFNLLATNEGGDPLDEDIITLSMSENLWAYVTTAAGGALCVVPVGAVAGAPGECPGGGWGAGFAPPFFAGFVPVAPAPLRPGRWVLIATTEDMSGESQIDVVSQPFRITSCPGPCPLAPAPDPSAAKAVFNSIADSIKLTCQAAKTLNLTKKLNDAADMYDMMVVNPGGAGFGTFAIEIAKKEATSLAIGGIKPKPIAYLPSALGWGIWSLCKSFFGANFPNYPIPFVSGPHANVPGTAAGVDAWLNDPPQPYATIAHADPIDWAQMSDLGDYHPDALDLARPVDDIRAYLAAGTTSYERFTAAVADGAAAAGFAHDQAQAIVDNFDGLRGALAVASRKIDKVVAAIQADPTAPDVITQADIDAVGDTLRRIRDDGFNSDETTALQALGLTDDELIDLRDSIGGDTDALISPTSFSASLGQLGHDLHGAIEAVDGFATQAAFYAASTVGINQTPVATFIAVPTAGVAPLDVTFTDTSTDGDSPTLTATWDFGDGTRGTGSPVHHVYAAGTYTATLTASDGSATGTASKAITASEAPPNHAPVGVADTYNTAQDSVLTVDAAAGVLHNDADADGDGLTATKLTDPAHGSVVLAADGSFVYTPTADYTGPDAFTHTANDALVPSAATTVSLSVTKVNHDPTAVDDALTVPFNGYVIVDVLKNDSDADGDPLRVSSSTDPAHGTADCSYGSICFYRPDTDFAGSDTFDYTIDDGRGATATGTVSIAVEANHPPIAVDDSITTRRSAPQPRTVNVLANDSDPDFNLIGLVSNTDPAHGSANCAMGAWNCSYTPGPDYVGPDSFEYTITDGNGGTDVGTVNVTVSENHAPMPVNDSAATFMGEQASVDVLANDSDPDGDTLVITENTAPVHGVTDCSSGTTCSYTPDGGYVGPDEFDYTVSDGDSTAAGHIAITVKPASNITHFTTIRGTDLAQSGFGGMVGNYTGTMTMSGVSGSVTGAYLYWQGPSNVTEPISSAGVTFAGHEVTGTNIGVTSDNCWGYPASQAFRADVTSLVTGDGTYPLEVARGDVRPNGASLIVFYDDGDPTNDLNVSLFEGNDSNVGLPFDPPGWHATLAGVDYQSGAATLSLHVSDGQANPKSALLLDSYVLSPEGGLIFQGDSVPGADVYNGNLWDINTFDIKSALSPGTNDLQLTMEGTSGDCISLVVAAIDVPANVTPVNHAPVGVADTYNTAQDSVLTVDAAAGVLHNDADADGDGLTATKLTDPAHGSVVLAADGSFVYTPTADYTGPDAFTYTANDALVPSAATIVSLDVTPVNHAPTLGLVIDQAIPEMVQFTLTLSGADPDGDTPLTYSVPTAQTGLSVGQSTGVLDWTPTEAQGPGDFPVTVRVTDPDGLFAERSFSIHVTEVNRTPALAAIAVRTVNPGDVVSLAASGSDPDVPTNALTYSVVSGPSGAAIDSTTGAFAWTSDGTLGDYPVTVRVTDPDGLFAERTVTIHVVRDATTLTLGGDSSGQYSDNATITATLKVGGTPVPGAAVSIGLGAASTNVTTNASGVAAAPFVIPGPSASLPVTASFAGTSSKAPSSANGSFTVEREDSTVVYAGDTTGLAGATLHLSAEFSDSSVEGFTGSNPETGASATTGDITKARVAFAVYSAASCLSGAPVATVSASVADTGPTGDGIGTAEATWSSASEGSFCIVPTLAGAAGTGVNSYYAAPPAQAAGLAIYIDAPGKVTGGGWIPHGDGRANFGLNAKSDGSKVKGNLVFIDRTMYLGEKVMLIVKSNAIDTLRASGSTFPIGVTLTGKASFKYISSVDGSTLFESGNATFSAMVIDSDAKGGVGDAFAIRVLEKARSLLVELESTPLGGGNVVAHLK